MKSKIKKYIFYWHLRIFSHRKYYCTFTGRNDGIGAQIHAAISVITSKSSFSYTAALLSNNIICYEPFWHPPLESWLFLNDLTSKAQIKKLSKLLLDKFR